LFNYKGIKFNTSHRFWEGIVFEENVLLEITRTVYGMLNPSYMTFVVLPKDYKLDDYYFNKVNPLVKYPIECTVEKFEKLKYDYTFTETSCIINNNSNVTVIIFVEGGVYFLPDTMQNMYFHPYAEIIANRLKCNVISFRHDNQNNYACKFGIKGYPPLTYSNLETVDYIKTILRTKLQQTKKLYTMSWCLGVYDALSVGEQLECNSVWTFDFFLSNIKTNNVFYSYFESNEKELADKTIGKTVPIDGLILDDEASIKNWYLNIDLVTENKYAKFRTIHHSDVTKPASNTLEMCLTKNYPFFEKYI